MITRLHDHQIYQVEESFEVYDESHAQALDHLLRHLQALTDYRNGNIHPDLVRRFGNDDRAGIALRDECVRAMSYYARLCDPLISTDEVRTILKALQATIPSLAADDSLG